MKSIILMTIASIAATVFAVPFGAPQEEWFTAVDAAVAKPNSTLDARDLSDTLMPNGYFQAFAGEACDGDAGEKSFFGVSEGPVCFENQDMHSFTLTRGSPACAQWTVAACSKQHCTGGCRVQSVYYDVCYDVNIGKNWQSTVVYCLR